MKWNTFEVLELKAGRQQLSTISNQASSSSSSSLSLPSSPASTTDTPSFASSPAPFTSSSAHSPSPELTPTSKPHLDHRLDRPQQDEILRTFDKVLGSELRDKLEKPRYITRRRFNATWQETDKRQHNYRPTPEVGVSQRIQDHWCTNTMLEAIRLE
jgi:hypothetical protein